MFHLLEVNVSLKSKWRGVLFTGKLVKSLLINANPKLKPLFEKTSGSTPKLIHVTPLYRVSTDGRLQCIYSQAIVDPKSTVRKVREVYVNGNYKFYVGFSEFINGYNTSMLDLIYSTLLDISGRLKFKHEYFDVELISISKINIEGYAQSIVDSLLKNPDARVKLKVVFSSPTLLRDPLRSNKQKSLIPTPMNIFSTPVYIYLYSTGKFTRRAMIKILLLLHRLFNEPYSLYSTVSIKWVVYSENKQPIPTLTGYVNLHLNKAYYEEYSIKYDLGELLQRILSITLALGTGTSRASGFGHVDIQVKNSI